MAHQGLEITEVRVTLRDEDKLRAFASITFNHCFVVRGLKVIQGNNGMFVAMPARKRADGQFQDIAHPINSAMRSELEEIVLREYKKEVERQRT